MTMALPFAAATATNFSVKASTVSSSSATRRMRTSRSLSSASLARRIASAEAAAEAAAAVLGEAAPMDGVRPPAAPPRAAAVVPRLGVGEEKLMFAVPPLLPRTGVAAIGCGPSVAPSFRTRGLAPLRSASVPVGSADSRATSNASFCALTRSSSRFTRAL